MVQTLNDVHHQFASFFKSPGLQPYAYLVSRKLSEGHICLQLDSLEEDWESLPSVFKEQDSVTFNLELEQQVGKDNLDTQPFILSNNRLYLQRYFKYETAILERIIEFTKAGQREREKRLLGLQKHSALIKDLFKAHSSTDLPYCDWQLAAAITAVLNNFTIITGGPGTGKTTTIAKVLAILFATDSDLKVALAAPTGKAAARMAESLKSAKIALDERTKERFLALEPSTMHRLLGYVPGSIYFKHNSGNPLPYDVVIVDESSMIDVAMFSKLLSAIGPDTRLILLGDKDQLASVEAGSLFGDLCQSQDQLNLFSKDYIQLINSFMDGKFKPLSDYSSPTITHPLFEHLVELQVSHRFKGDEGIGKISRAVINNDQEVIKNFMTSNTDPQVRFDSSYSQELFEEFVSGYQEYIQEPDIATALKKLNKLRVLCAIREGEQGLYTTNRKIEKVLSDKKLISLKGDFYEHRPVIITSNNYTLGLYNGDIGIVRPDNQGNLKVWFETAEGKLNGILPGLLSQVETVYAMTIHKSQGSEFDQVLVLLPDTTEVAILTRELLYTGITRAKSEVYIQATEELVLETAARQVSRASGISERFLNLS
ncbi:exodeoxyribonuclease V subunit alpha [Desertivirga arenae]|uniref:exodeoxyribonuclease V subunit alpha n=1 Tax=Desertivirga arenae TaxID=2810309 RepID=UPI001A977F80|nr:exodeoxyribonuclease V subunit alpha [Pedobacter sp. SYSU D00823]